MPYASRPKQRAYQRRRLAQRRRSWLSDKACVDCGAGPDDAQLELDHVDPRLKLTHRLFSLSEKRRLSELEKIVVRCSPCHRAKGIRQGDLLRGAKLQPADVLAI